MKQQIKLFVETENNVSGSRGHSVTYPMFSNWANASVLKNTDCENSRQVLYRKITIEDGEFENAYSNRHRFDKYSYTGQHTNLNVALVQGINENAPRFVYGSIFVRNKYGSQSREFRLDLVRMKLQNKRGKNGKWFDFEPSRYID